MCGVVEIKYDLSNCILRGCPREHILRAHFYLKKVGNAMASVIFQETNCTWILQKSGQWCMPAILKRGHFSGPRNHPPIKR